MLCDQYNRQAMALVVLFLLPLLSITRGYDFFEKNLEFRFFFVFCVIFGCLKVGLKQER
jgi:hypothetical protein